MINFFLRYKKIFLIAAFALFIFILGYLLYFVFFRPLALPPSGELGTPTSTPTGFPQSATGTGQAILPGGGAVLPGQPQKPLSETDNVARGGITKTVKINNTSSLGAVLSPDGSHIQYYDQSDGKFYRIDNSGQATPLSDKIFHNVEKITWANNADKAILEYPDGANIFYDFNTKKQKTLPKHWKDFAFSSDDSQIALKSIGLDPDNRWLAIANDDGSSVRPLEPLGDKDATVYPSWSPNKQMAAMFTESIDLNRQNVYFVGLNNENFKSMTVEGRGFQPLWAPNEGRLLYSVYSSDNDLKPSLWIANAEGENIGSGRKNLNVMTWANKCVFANDTDVYCAVPKQLEPGAGMFPEMAKASEDELYKIDTKTGLKKLIAVPDGRYSMSRLIVSANGYYLYFTNNFDKRLYKINLK